MQHEGSSKVGAFIQHHESHVLVAGRFVVFNRLVVLKEFVLAMKGSIDTLESRWYTRSRLPCTSIAGRCRQATLSDPCGLRRLLG